MGHYNYPFFLIKKQISKLKQLKLCLYHYKKAILKHQNSLNIKTNFYEHLKNFIKCNCIKNLNINLLLIYMNRNISL